MERWEVIKDFPSYMVSTSGRVKTMIWNKEKILKTSTRKGYQRVTLYKDYKRYTKSVHRLVAETFIEKKRDKPLINHIDGNKSNNNINNIEWCTASENTIHAMKNDLFKNNHNNIKIRCIETKETFSSIKECSIKMKIDSSSISKVLKGKRKHAKNFTFEKVGD